MLALLLCWATWAPAERRVLMGTGATIFASGPSGQGSKEQIPSGNDHSPDNSREIADSYQYIPLLELIPVTSVRSMTSTHFMHPSRDQSPAGYDSTGIQKVEHGKTHLLKHTLEGWFPCQGSLQACPRKPVRLPPRNHIASRSEKLQMRSNRYSENK